jgi:Ser/Thr protein kinase RdoA (MazF antagonist)
LTDCIEEEVVAFWSKFPATGVIHGDTKLENFLFDQATGRVRSLIDLDTVMAGHWLMDWADLIRSLVNVAGEKAESLDAVKTDTEVFAAAQSGFMEELAEVSVAEVEAMALAPRYLAFEQALRFLTDYLRGDNYYRLSATDPPELNLQKGLVQLRLFEEFATVAIRRE